MPSFDYIRGYRYHVVFVTNHRRPHFKEPRWATFAANELTRVSVANAFLVEAFCVMPDHIHTLLRGDADLHSDLTKFSHAFKQSVGYQFRQSEGVPLWHRSYYDHVLRPDEPAMAHVAYILGNPVRAGLVNVATQWAYSGPATVFGELERADRSEDLSLRVDAVAIQIGELLGNGARMPAGEDSPPATVFGELEGADRSEDLSLRVEAVATRLGELVSNGEKKMLSTRKLRQDV